MTDEPELEDPAVASARFLLLQQTYEPVDVLVFGESTLQFVGPDEEDQRSLADLLSTALRPQSSLVVAGPGFGVGLHREFARLAATQPARPLVVTSLFVRGTLPAFLRHPIYGHRRQIELISELTGGPSDVLKTPYVPPSDEEFTAYESMPYPTLVAERTIADFMGALRPPRSPGSAEHLRWLFEFHYGGVPDPTAVEAFTAYGRALRDAGFPVVAFLNPVNFIEAAEHLGPEFHEWYGEWQAAVHDAFVAGYGPGAVVLETGNIWQPEDFVEPAVEHLAAHARIQLADRLVAAVKESTLSVRGEPVA